MANHENQEFQNKLTVENLSQKKQVSPQVSQSTSFHSSLQREETSEPVTTTVIKTTSVTVTTGISKNITSSCTTQQNATLTSVNSTSFGYYISTDPTFGNVIIPVIPRL